jgi:glycosyltransferase involved in cell wall biosynthesis
MNRKKICLVIPSLQAGGMERVMSELCKFFIKKSNLEVHLILYGKTREIFYSIPEEIIIHKPEFEFNNNLRIFSAIRTLLYLRKQIKQISPYSILSFGEYWNNFVLLALFGLKYSVYISDRCQPNKSLGILHDNLRKWLYHKAAGIVAQTQQAKEIYNSLYHNGNIVVIGNPVRKILEDRDTIKRENIVLSVGRLIKSKHHDELIRLFSRIDKKDWKLIIVGYDHLKQKNMQKLKRLIRELNEENRIILSGKQDNIERYYLKSRIFAFTSSSEGFPNVIGEAMSAGLPVVAFDCVAGPSEMIRDNHNGYLVPLFDYESFHEKIQLLIQDKEMREVFGKNAREDIRIFSINNIGEQYLRVILNNNL